MGDVADDMMEEARQWHEEAKVCPKHGVRYLPLYGPCPYCEDPELLEDD